MRKKLILLIVFTLLTLSACSDLSLLQVQEKTDPFAPLPTFEGGNFVSCSQTSDCQNYLEQHGEFNVNSECRQDSLCYYETVPMRSANPSGGGTNE